MVDIDERVVQMKFDATDFDQNTKKTMSTLDKLREKLSFKDVVDNDAMNSIADNVQKVADKAYTIVDRTIDKIKDNIANKLVSYIQDNTVGQLKAGWDKYADMTTSVATLKAQGYAMEDINEQLERLMYFTDETSYKFTDMVGEIGKFTASGQKLEDATKAMMGIADWAALSGKNANEASRAMYQLSQALGAGYIRLQDWKSIQTLNMDTKEFREKALDAAEAVGTVKKNIDGTYKSLVGDKKAFSIQNFSETLSKGQWFTTEVMMKVFGEYADAVDEIREIYLDNQEEIPTAQIINDVKESNEELIEKFNQVNFKGTRKDITDIISRWKKVEKVTAETAEEYAAINDLTVEQAKLQMAEKNNGYAEYLKEYGQIFGGTVEDAEAALDDWHNYISEFGIKAFQSGQEAKTFLEAIESAKDAASTVWTNIYTTIFGDYNEAKEIWTHLANNLYDIFVGRLWSVADIFDYWKNGEKEALTEPLEEYENELAILKRKEGFGIISDEEKEKVIELEQEIANLQYQLENKLYRNGRRMFMQGAEAIGAAFKFNITKIREAWDDTFEENESANKLLDWTERFRLAAFKFSTMIMDEKNGLASTDFYNNIARGFRNLLAPIGAVRKVIKAVISEFVPAGTTVIDVLVKISEGFRDMTAKLVPSQQTILNLARVLRGIVAIIKLIGKAAMGVYVTFIRPLASAIFELISGIASGLLETFANIGDSIYELEEGLDILDAMAYVGDILKDVFGKVFEIIGTGVGYLIRGLAPILGFIFSLVEELAAEIKKLFGGDKVKSIKNVGDAFGDMSKRVKEAWRNSFSLRDVWEHYKGGSGLSNFLLMLGDMLDVIVTKIGVTIGAIFGLEEAAAESKAANALAKLKSLVAKTFEIIGWLYTNVLRPVLGTVIQFIATVIRDLGKSLREGDIKGALQLIREIIKTFTSAQIFKLFSVLSKVLGSGGLLRIFRNGAKALKGLWKLWGSEAINNIASAILKLGVAIVLVASGLAALTFLPQKNLEKLNGMMISFVVVLAVILGMVVALTALADNATWGLLTMAFAFASITVMVVVFMIAAKKLHTYLESLFGGEDGKAGLGKIMGGLLSIAAPLLSVITVLLLVFKAISSLGKGGSVLTFSLGFVGMFIAINNIVNSMELMITMLRKYSLEEVLSAAAILLAMFSLLALATKFMGSFEIADEAKFGGGIAAGVAMAITIASLALVIRMVLIPTLDTLIDNMERWPDYVAALILIAGAMLTMAGTIRLMNVKIANGGFFAEMGNFISTMGNLLFFVIVVNEIKNSLIPLLKELSETEFNENLVGNVILFGGLLYVLAVAIKIVAKGIAEVIKAMSWINYKALGSFVILLGAVILGIIAINALLENNGIKIEVSDVLWVILGIVGILTIFGTFALLMSKTFAGSSQGNRMADLGKLLQSLALIVGAVVVGLIAVLGAFKLLYKDDLSTGITVMSTFLGTLAASIGGLLIAFGATVKMMSTNVISINASEMKQVKGMFKVLMGIIIAVMAGILIALAEFKLLYDGNEKASLLPVLELVGGTLLTVCLIFKSFRKTIQELIKYNLANGATNTSMKHLKEVFLTLMLGVIGIMTAIVAGTAIIGEIYKDDMSRSVLPVLEIVIGSAGVFFVICSTLGKFIREIQNTLLTLTIGDFNLNRISGIILGMMLGTAAMIAAVVLGIVAINESTKGINIARTIAPALEIIIATAGTFFVIASTIGYLLKTLVRSGIVFNEQYSAIIKFLATIAIIIAGLSVVFGLILGALSNTSGENNITNAVAMILGVVGVFGLLIVIITSATTAAPAFNAAATTIATGIAKIAGALLLLGIAADVLKSAFGLGETIIEKIDGGVKKEAEIKSPSKLFAQDGKYIDQGLASGIKKNANLAASASKALAVTTNKAFCKELGIASPSKVFYENGKFVIRGFINGANSEYQKNKDIGSAIGEGFAETAAEGISDEFEKLWTESGMLDDMKAALKDAGADLGSEAGKSLFDSLMGEGENVSATSLLEDKDVIQNPTKVATEWSRYKNELTKAENEYEKLLEEGKISEGGQWSDYTFNEKEKELSKNVEEARKNLQRFEASTYVSEETFNDPTYQKKLKQYYSDIDAAEEELQKFYAENPIEYDDDGEISAEWKNKEDKLLKKVKKTKNSLNNYISKSFSSSGSTGGFFASFGEMFSGFGTQFGELFGVSLDESITKRFGLDGISYSSIKSSFTSLFSASGEEGAKSFKSSLYSFLGLDDDGKDTKGNFTSIGNQIGGGIAAGIKGGLADLFLHNKVARGLGWIAYKIGIMDAQTYEDIFGEGPTDETAVITKYQNKVNDQMSPLINPNGTDNTSGRAQIKQMLADRYIEKNWEHFTNMSDEQFSIFMDEFTAEISKVLNEYEKSDNFNGYFDQYGNLKNLGDMSFFYNGKLTSLLTSLLPLTDFNNWWKTNMTYQEKEKLKEDTKEKQDKGSDIYSRLKNEISNIDDTSELSFILSSHMKWVEDEDGNMKKVFDFNLETLKEILKEINKFYNNKSINIDFLKELLGSYSVRNSQINEIYNDKKFGYIFTGNENYKITKDARGAAIGEFDKLAQQYKLSGEQMIEFLYYGMSEGLLEYDYQNKLFKIIDDNAYAQLKEWFKQFEINSPSTATERMMRYFVDGMPIGIEEELPEVLNSIDDATDLITDETIAGLNGMQYMLDNDITPTVTPIFDGAQLQNGVDTINSALDSVQPRVDSAIGSFGIESTDYTNNLTSLQNRIDNLTSVVDSFMTMIEGGAGVNVHVTAEADPTNIYNLVVDANRTEFKRTGRNNLAY